MSLFSIRLSAGRIGLFYTGHLDSPVLTPQSMETKNPLTGRRGFAVSPHRQKVLGASRSSISGYLHESTMREKGKGGWG
jgi:hypothetical protein